MLLILFLFLLLFSFGKKLRMIDKIHVSFFQELDIAYLDDGRLPSIYMCYESVHKHAYSCSDFVQEFTSPDCNPRFTGAQGRARKD